MDFNYSALMQELRSISLNDLLDQLEVDISRVGQGKFENVQNLLVKMDEAQQRIENMFQKQLPVKAESAQFDYLVSDLERNAKRALNDLGGAKRLAILRKQKPPGQDYRWWHLDEIYANQWKKTLSKILIYTGGAGLLLVLLMIFYNTFLKPDPAVTARYTHQINTEQFLAEGDFAKALEEINMALDYSPAEPALLVIRGVIQTKLGNQEQANADFNTAETALGNHVGFLVLRSQSWLGVCDYQKSIEDSQDILREDPASAEGYFYFGKANELLQNYDTAINAYETASNLAASQGKAELNATIRISLAMLMQSYSNLVPTIQQVPTP